jgi:hypothetical protein
LRLLDSLGGLNVSHIGGGHLAFNLVNGVLFFIEKLLTLLDVSLQVIDVLLGIGEDLLELIFGETLRLLLDNVLELLHMLRVVC